MLVIFLGASVVVMGLGCWYWAEKAVFWRRRADFYQTLMEDWRSRWKVLEIARDEAERAAYPPKGGEKGVDPPLLH